MSKVDEILSEYGMTRENWECDPSFVAALMNALEDSQSEAEGEWNAALDAAARACEDQALWDMDDPGNTAAKLVLALKRRSAPK